MAGVSTKRNVAVAIQPRRRSKRRSRVVFISRRQVAVCLVSMSSLSRHGIEHQNPVVSLAVGRRLKLLGAFVGILTNDFPRSVARIVPPGFHRGALGFE